MEKLLGPLLKYPRLALIVLMIPTLVFAFYAWHVTVDPSNESLLPQGDITVEYLKEFNRIFGSDEVIVIALHSPQLFTEENFASLSALTDKISQIPYVTQVVSLVNFKDVRSDVFGPALRVPFEEVLSHKKTLQDFASEVAQNPLVQNLLLSRDGKTTAILVDITPREGDPFYRKKIVEKIREIIAEAESQESGVGDQKDKVKHPSSKLDFYVAGIPVEVTDLAEYIRRDQKIFLPFIFLIITLALSLTYSTVLEVLLPLLVMFLSLIWTIGLYGLQGKALNAITTLLTPIVMVTSVENVIHFLNRYREDFYNLGDPQKALVRSFSIIAIPCFLTSFTTAIGFASLMVNPIPAVQDFGIYASLGATFAYFLAMTLVPLTIVQVKVGKLDPWKGKKWDYLEKLLSYLEEIILSKKNWVLSITGILLVVSSMGLFHIKITTDIIRSFKSTAPLYQATQFIDEHLTGVNSLEITVRGPKRLESVEGSSVQSPESEALNSRITLKTLKKIEELQQFLNTFPEIVKTLSLVDLIKRLYQADHEDDPAFYRLPEDESDLEEYLDFLATSKDREYLQFITEDLSLVRISCRVKAIGTDRSQQMLQQIQTYINTAFQEGEEIRITGSMLVLSNMSTYLVRNQIKSMAAALPLILISMGLLYRSTFIGLMSAIPNLIPILMVYGFMGWTGVELSVPTAMISSIVIGLAINNTIYFLSRFKLEFPKLKDYTSAIQATLKNTGRAMIASSMILVLGFWVGIFGSFKPSIYFALLTGMTLLLALISNLIILPLTLIIFKPLK
ncbi:MAG TPA: MMPL family transporter [Candidatus Limnocylindrales bacterium]|nr:MMPL family transporter [Candidatus Limnocylindrales bacterium]